MRIGIDGRELAAGARTGIGRYVTELLGAASREGHECLVYGDRQTLLPAALPGVTLRILDSRWTRLYDQALLPRRLAQDRITIFLSPYYKAPLLAPCPVVLTIHDLYFIRYPGRRRLGADIARTWLARLYARRAARIIADSESSKRAIVALLRVKPWNVTVIPVALGAEFKPVPLREEVKRRYGVTPPYVLYVGNFKPHKNLARLMSAYAKLPTALRGSHQLVLAGCDESNQPPLTSQARALGIADRVVMPGRIEDRDLPALYSGCALFVLPSLMEGFGLPLLEAMACGAPVVAANRAALPEVAGEAALLVDPEDESALASAIARVASNPGLRDSLTRRGLTRASEFSRDRTAGRVLALLREITETRRREAVEAA
jgi:glycosyltransferase involved in cell wall biosynthesis